MPVQVSSRPLAFQLSWALSVVMGVGFVHGIAIIITGSGIIGGALGHWFG